MCEYCDFNHKHHSILDVVHGKDMCENEGRIIHIEKNIEGFNYIAFESYECVSGETYPINYCPMCGEKL